MYSFNGNVGFMCVFPCMPPFPADIEPILLRLLSFKEHLCQFYSISTGRGCTSHCSTISGLISVCLIWWSVSLFICQNKCFFPFFSFIIILFAAQIQHHFERLTDYERHSVLRQIHYLGRH